jgi:hypothetical protein
MQRSGVAVAVGWCGDGDRGRRLPGGLRRRRPPRRPPPPRTEGKAGDESPPRCGGDDIPPRCGRDQRGDRRGGGGSGDQRNNNDDISPTTQGETAGNSTSTAIVSVVIAVCRRCLSPARQSAGGVQGGAEDGGLDRRRGVQVLPKSKGVPSREGLAWPAGEPITPKNHEDTYDSSELHYRTEQPRNRGFSHFSSLFFGHFVTFLVRVSWFLNSKFRRMRKEVSIGEGALSARGLIY